MFSSTPQSFILFRAFTFFSFCLLAYAWLLATVGEEEALGIMERCNASFFRSFLSLTHSSILALLFSLFMSLSLVCQCMTASPFFRCTGLIPVLKNFTQVQRCVGEGGRETEKSDRQVVTKFWRTQASRSTTFNLASQAFATKGLSQLLKEGDKGTVSISISASGTSTRLFSLSVFFSLCVTHT